MVKEKEERSESEEREGKEAPGGGSVRRSLSSFCIRRLSLAACAIFDDDSSLCSLLSDLDSLAGQNEINRKARDCLGKLNLEIPLINEKR